MSHEVYSNKQPRATEFMGPNPSPPHRNKQNSSLPNSPELVALPSNAVCSQSPSATCADGQPPNPFDPKSLRWSQDFSQGLGIKKSLLTVPVRKPSKESWVRTHPSPDYQIQTGVLELKEERETYLVARELWSDLATETAFSPRALFTAITRQRVLFLWPVRLPGADGKIDSWNQSSMEAVQLASKNWVRVAANMGLGAYDVYEASAEVPDPVWPDVPFQDVLEVAFKGKFIDTLKHPVLKRLRGES